MKLKSRKKSIDFWKKVELHTSFLLSSNLICNKFLKAFTLIVFQGQVSEELLQKNHQPKLLHGEFKILGFFRFSDSHDSFSSFCRWNRSGKSCERWPLHSTKNDQIQEEYECRCEHQKGTLNHHKFSFVIRDFQRERNSNITLNEWRITQYPCYSRFSIFRRNLFTSKTIIWASTTLHFRTLMKFIR